VQRSNQLSLKANADVHIYSTKIAAPNIAGPLAIAAFFAAVTAWLGQKIYIEFKLETSICKILRLTLSVDYR
jgi:hypothetical protein